MINPTLNIANLKLKVKKIFVTSGFLSKKADIKAAPGDKFGKTAHFTGKTDKKKGVVPVNYYFVCNKTGSKATIFWKRQGKMGNSAVIQGKIWVGTG